MIGTLISILAGFVMTSISTLGYLGIVATMAIESACIPLPSEVIMPFSGFLVSEGRFTLWGITLAGAIGNVIGSILAYAAGRFGGRPFVWTYGKYFLISHRDIEMADRWFSKYGQLAVFATRMMPVVRTFISLPAGIAKVRFLPFLIWTFLGSLPWCFGLGYLGFQLGARWETLGSYFHKFDTAIGIVLLAGLIWWIRRHVKHVRS
ncbi:MAG: DedA family protein [Deltaproteobacteria bacterium]|nr:DedA family protein [Deltaproteobacteria bacterium]